MTTKRRPAREITQEAVLDLLAAPVPLRDIPSAVGIDRTTVWRWLGDPQFQARLAERRRDVWGVIGDEVRTTAALALARFAEEIRQGNLEAAAEFLRLVGPALGALREPHVPLEAVTDNDTAPHGAMPAELAALLDDNQAPNPGSD